MLAHTQSSADREIREGEGGERGLDKLVKRVNSRQSCASTNELKEISANEFPRVVARAPVKYKNLKIPRHTVAPRPSPPPWPPPPLHRFSLNGFLPVLFCSVPVSSSPGSSFRHACNIPRKKPLVPKKKNRKRRPYNFICLYYVPGCNTVTRSSASFPPREIELD